MNDNQREECFHIFENEKVFYSNLSKREVEEYFAELFAFYFERKLTEIQTYLIDKIVFNKIKRANIKILKIDYKYIHINNIKRLRVFNNERY